MTTASEPTPSRVGMGRVTGAFIAVPVLASLPFGVIAVVALPLMLILTGLVMLPTFLFLRRRGWLHWGHAVLAGLVCSKLGCALVLLSASPEYADWFGLGLALNLACIGGLAGAAFWWIGIFRNPAFPFVSSAWPYGMLALVPIAVALVLAQRPLEPAFAKGQIVDTHGSSAQAAHVRLVTGQVVESFISDALHPTPLAVGQCWDLMNHWSTTHLSRIYSLESPAGEGASGCQPASVVQTVVH